MRFQVKRTSSPYADDGRPCPEAVEGLVDRWDNRTFKSPEEHDAKLGHREKWTDRGTEHQVVYGPRGGVQGIKRKLDPEKAWFIELPDLDALMAFYEKYGSLVLEPSWADGETPCIEIYDGYRE